MSGTMGFYFLVLSDISKIKVWKMKAIVPEQWICQCTISSRAAPLCSIFLMLLLKFHHKTDQFHKVGGREKGCGKYFNAVTYPWWREREFWCIFITNRPRSWYKTPLWSPPLLVFSRSERGGDLSLPDIRDWLERSWRSYQLVDPNRFQFGG